MTADNLNKDKYIFELKNKLKKLQSQKDILLSELNSMEEKHEKTVQLYSRSLPPILDYIQDDNPSFGAALKVLSTSLKRGESTEKIEVILKLVRNSILQDVSEHKKSRGKQSFFSSFLKGSSGEEQLNQFKEGYLEIISNLKQMIDAHYGDQLNQIAEKITQADSFKNIVIIRNQLFDIIQSYINSIGTDREKISSFVQEIIKRILMIENHLLKSYDTNESSAKSNEAFSSILNKEIGVLKNNVDVAQCLDDLKAQVSKTLSSIEKAIIEKQKNDERLVDSSRKNRSNFQGKFLKLKKELDQALKHSRKLEAKLNHDPLTGALNRRAYNKRIDNEMERFKRYGSIFSLIIIDIDHFKKVNDTYGHAVGDKCLQEITRRAAPVLRKNDMLARYGGEEFVAIMPETSSKGALAVAEKIRKTIEKIEFIYKQDTVKMTVSIGVSQVKDGETSHKHIFERADTALYRAKEAGRNKVELED